MRILLNNIYVMILLFHCFAYCTVSRYTTSGGEIFSRLVKETQHEGNVL